MSLGWHTPCLKCLPQTAGCFQRSFWLTTVPGAPALSGDFRKFAMLDPLSALRCLRHRSSTTHECLLEHLELSLSNVNLREPSQTSFSPPLPPSCFHAFSVPVKRTRQGPNFYGFLLRFANLFSVLDIWEAYLSFRIMTVSKARQINHSEHPLLTFCRFPLPDLSWPHTALIFSLRYPVTKTQ